jgi:hypothetical protein
MITRVSVRYVAKMLRKSRDAAQVAPPLRSPPGQVPQVQQSLLGQAQEGHAGGKKMMDIFRRLQKASESLHESMADIDNAPGIVRRLEMSHSEAEIEKKKSLLSDGLRVYDIITGFK